MTQMNHAEIYRMLRGLREELAAIVKRDPEQEVQGIALPALDQALSSARRLLGEDHPIAQRVREVVTPEAVQRGEPVRAVDALIATRTLLEAVGEPMPCAAGFVNPDNYRRRLGDPLSLH